MLAGGKRRWEELDASSKRGMAVGKKGEGGPSRLSFLRDKSNPFHLF
jgi:hypothetical protein